MHNLTLENWIAISDPGCACNTVETERLLWTQPKHTRGCLMGSTRSPSTKASGASTRWLFNEQLFSCPCCCSEMKKKKWWCAVFPVWPDSIVIGTRFAEQPVSVPFWCSTFEQHLANSFCNDELQNSHNILIFSSSWFLLSHSDNVPKTFLALGAPWCFLFALVRSSYRLLAV